MSVIDITKGFRQYPSEDLREYALKGLVCCGDYDLSEFLEHLLQGTHSKSELDEAKANAYDEGYEAGRHESDVSIEFWENGKADSWQQFTLECNESEKASTILDKIRDSFVKDGCIVKVTNIFKL